MNFELRPATAGDLEQILHIYNQEILTGTANWNDQIRSSEQQIAWFTQLQQQHYPVWVICQQQTVAGYAYFTEFRTITGYKYTVEHSIFVSPHYKRQGLGKRLLNKMIELATQQGFQVMIAAIDSKNLGSIALHKQVGFVHCGYLAQVGYKFDQWRDLIYMQYLINKLSYKVNEDRKGETGSFSA